MKRVTLSTRTKRTIARVSLCLCVGILLAVILAVGFFPRPKLPSHVAEDYCARYRIRLDGTSIERIYHSPETILADPTAFLQEDTAYLLLGEHRARVNNPFPLKRWTNDIQALVKQPLAKREQRAPYRLYQRIMANPNAFCQEVASSVMAYLPEGTDAEATIYLTALEGSAPAFASGRGIAFSLSHPLFAGAQAIHEPTGLSAFYNLGSHELFHIYFNSSFQWPGLEEHMLNEIVMDMTMALQNEGIATHISHQLKARYPSPLEWLLYVVDFEPVVRLYINEMNKLLAIAQTHPTGEAYDAIYRDIASLCYQKKGFNIVGATMAMEIESELGREALANTVSGDAYAFVRAYNSVAEEDMRIRWSTTP